MEYVIFENGRKMSHEGSEDREMTIIVMNALRSVSPGIRYELYTVETTYTRQNE